VPLPALHAGRIRISGAYEQFSLVDVGTPR